MLRVPLSISLADNFGLQLIALRVFSKHMSYVWFPSQFYILSTLNLIKSLPFLPLALYSFIRLSLNICITNHQRDHKEPAVQLLYILYKKTHTLTRDLGYPLFKCKIGNISLLHVSFTRITDSYDRVEARISPMLSIDDGLN